MITLNDVDAIQGYVEDTVMRMGCGVDAAKGDASVELDSETGAAKVSVPEGADPFTFCDILAQLLGRAGYSMWDVWIDQWNSSVVMIDDKEEEVP